MDFEEIRYEVADHVLTITLNRPERLNAFTPTMGHELIEAFDQADADDEVRVVIVTGEGRGFCAGADLGGGGGTFDWRDRQTEDEIPRDRGGRVSLRIFESDQAGDRSDQRSRGRRRHHDDAADGHPPRGRGRPRSASSSRAAGSCRRPLRAGSCRASSGSARRWSGWRPAACSRRRRRWRDGSSAACTPTWTCSPAARALAREISESAPGLGRAGTAHALDDAGRRTSDGRAPRRLEGDVLARPVRRCARGRHVIPREARLGVHRPRQRGAARAVSRAAGACLFGIGAKETTKPAVKRLGFEAAVICEEAVSFAAPSPMEGQLPPLRV